MGMRIIFAVFIVCGCVLLGKSLSSAMHRRVSTLERLIRGTKMLRIHMSGMLELVSEALSATNCEAFAAVGQEMRNSGSAKQAWQKIRRKMLARGGYLDALSKRDCEILDDLFDNLGASGRREQEIIILSSIRRFEEQLHGAKIQLNERDRLNISIGFLIGLIIALAVV